MTKIICLHGFLGAGSDFNFLKPYYDIYSPDLDNLVDFSLKSISETILSHVDEDTILLGYSFGARLAMQLFLESPDSYKKMLLFAGHMGLDNSSERAQRLIFENRMIELLKNVSMKEFLKIWNDYPIFDNDTDMKLSNQCPLRAQVYFHKWGLSKQPFLKDKLLEFRDRLHIFYGEKDVKYCQYALESLQDFNVSFIKDKGHRLINDKQLIVDQIGK